MDIKAEIEKAGYRLHSTYKKAHAKLLLTCDKGHDYEASWSTFSRGCRCPHCAGQVVTNEQVKAKVDELGYKLNSVYTSNKKRLSVTCDKGHDYEARWDHFRAGHRCPHCSGHIVTNEQVKAEIAEFGYRLNSNYESSTAKLSLTCDKGHDYESSWDSFQRGCRCSHCAQYGFKWLKPATLYYVRFQHEGNFFYKIGVTNHSPKVRFKYEPISHTIISQTQYLLGDLAFQEEQRILKEYKQFQYKGKPFLANGSTELFTKDVLMLDADILTV